jgi:hypothetical protein
MSATVLAPARPGGTSVAAARPGRSCAPTPSARPAAVRPARTVVDVLPLHPCAACLEEQQLAAALDAAAYPPRRATLRVVDGDSDRELCTGHAARLEPTPTRYGSPRRRR